MRKSVDEMMANLTEDENCTTTDQYFLCTSVVRTSEKTFILATGLPLSIIAFLGNVVIICSLQRVSSLHPPSKLLFGCLAFTDLGVGLIVHPLRFGRYLSLDHSKTCHYLSIVYLVTGFVFAGLSLLTITAISVDRLFALSLGLGYRQVVTVKRVRALIACFWVSIALLATVVFQSVRIALGIAFAVLLSCIIISTFCYIKIYHALRLRLSPAQRQGHQGQPKGIQQSKARYKETVSTAVWVQMTLLACYLPYGLVGASKAITGLNTPSLSLALTLSTSLLLSNSTINPFLYCWRMRVLLFIQWRNLKVSSDSTHILYQPLQILYNWTVCCEGNLVLSTELIA